MRVLQVTASADRRGAEVFADQLATSLRSRGHHVDTVCLSDHAGALAFRPIGARRTDPRVLARLVSAMRRHQVTVVHGGAGLVPTAQAATAARRPFVYRNIGDPAYWGAVRGADLRIGWPLRRAARTVALYEGAAQYLARSYRLSPAALVVASNAVDSSRFPRRSTSEVDEARRALGLGGAGPLLGYIGALSPEKRPEWAVELCARTPGASLVVAGSGPLQASLEEAAREGAPDRVRFLGSVDTPEQVLRCLDALLLPSRTEGIPGVLIEALLVGVPVVATDVGGVGEVVSRLGGGVATTAERSSDLQNHLDRVLADPGAYVADRATVVAAHDIESVADVWERTLEDVIAGR